MIIDMVAKERANLNLSFCLSDRAAELTRRLELSSAGLSGRRRWPELDKRSKLVRRLGSGDHYKSGPDPAQVELQLRYHGNWNMWDQNCFLCQPGELSSLESRSLWVYYLLWKSWNIERAIICASLTQTVLLWQLEHVGPKLLPLPAWWVVFLR